MVKQNKKVGNKTYSLHPTQRWEDKGFRPPDQRLDNRLNGKRLLELGLELDPKQNKMDIAGKPQNMQEKKTLNFKTQNLKSGNQIRSISASEAL